MLRALKNDEIRFFFFFVNDKEKFTTVHFNNASKTAKIFLKKMYETNTVFNKILIFIIKILIA